MANTLKLSAVGLLALLAAGMFAQTATTTPVGFMRYTISGGTLTAPVSTAIAVPLHDVGGVSGASAGVIASVSANTVTVTSAGWTPNALATPAIPYALIFKTGTFAGATAKIIANTATMLSLESGDLALSGVAVGDRFEIIPIDTLGTFFGGNSLLGGTSSANADVVYLLSAGVWNGYYYNSNTTRWEPKTGRSSDQNNVVLFPGTGLVIERKGPATELIVTGTVPDSTCRTSVANRGNSIIHAGFPTDTTLGALALDNLVSGWVKNANAQTADWIYIMQAGSWSSYYHNGTYWRSTTGRDTSANAVTIPAGAPILLSKKGSASGSAYFVRNLPYSLN